MAYGGSRQANRLSVRASGAGVGGGSRQFEGRPEAVSRHVSDDEGDAWLEAGESALLWVPSAVAPESWNVLLNPLHREARLVTMVWARRAAYDKRLFHV
jgi:RES domain-containing protein